MTGQGHVAESGIVRIYSHPYTVILIENISPGLPIAELLQQYFLLTLKEITLRIFQHICQFKLDPVNYTMTGLHNHQNDEL